MVEDVGFHVHSWREWMMRRLIAGLAVLGLVLAGCSSDPTTSDEYAALEQELAQTKSELVEVTTERDALVAEADKRAGVELPAEAAEALDNYNKAVLNANGEAMLNYVTEDFTFLSYGNDVQERDFRADWVTQYYKGFEMETIGDLMVLGGGDTYIVDQPERVTTPALAEGFSVIRLVQVEGVWLVDAHRFTGE